jgi:SAM-dependent methyltransferase
MTTNTAFGMATEFTQAMWSQGDFGRIAVRHVLPGELLVEAVDVHAGEAVLDVGSGTGNVAIAAARREADVIATDFVESLLEQAAQRAEGEGLPIRTRIADAQALPFPDGSFDVVLSSFGVIFAPDQETAAAELVRVCRPGGRIGITCWPAEGLIGETMRASMRRVGPPPIPGFRPPTDWGNEERLRELFGDRVSDLRVERREMKMIALSSEAIVDFAREYLPPAKATWNMLDDAERAEARAEMIAIYDRFNKATDGTLAATAEYLEVVAVRA